MVYHLEFDIDFRRNPYKGRYIVIEGIDGSGKTTQTKRLCAYFEKAKIPVVLTGEPRKGNGLVGGLIQKILKAQIKIPPVAFQYLFSAERAIHHQELIIPSLRSGKYVVSDRCLWSAVPYGIMDKMMGEGKSQYDYKEGRVILAAQSILSMYHQFIIPDFTFYLKVSVGTAMRRLKDKHDENEIYEKKNILEKVAMGYDWLAKEFPKEITVVDGERSVEEVTEEILMRINTNIK